VVFDFREVEKVRFEEANEYNSEDLIYAPVDSGGMTCTKFYWVKRGTQKSKELMIKKKRSEIESLKWKLEWAEKELNELLNI
jgi:hypothetical protein